VPIKRSIIMESFKRHEGLRLKPYLCTAGYLTIGYGRNLEGKGLSREECDMLAENDLTDGIREALRAFPWVAKVDEVRAAVIVECAMSLGTAKFLEFKKCIAACVANDWETAAAELLDSKLPEPDQWGRARAYRMAEQLRTGKLQPV
jgi:lysozyme